MPALNKVICYWLFVIGKKQGSLARNDQRRTTNQSGFTLIELMIAITIIAIISSAGMVTYSNSQKLGRDSKRKQDLQQIQKALAIYYQDNKRYPSVGGWAFSNSGAATWLTGLDTNYIGVLPKDPINSCPAGGNVWLTPTCYIYAYVDNPGAGCSASAGQYYALVTNLENTSDPQANIFKSYIHCPGYPIGGSPALYAIGTAN